MKNNEKQLSQDEMIKNLVRDYPEEALDFFYPDLTKRYGKPTKIDFNIQEAKKHSHYDRNMKNDLAIIYRFKNEKRVILTLLEHWSDKNKFDIHRFAHYIIDLDFQFPDYEKLPIALFTDSNDKWIKPPQAIIEIKCLDELFLTFKYKLIRMKDYEAAKYKDTKNKFIAVLRSAMKWDLKNKLFYAVNFIGNYGMLEKDIKIKIKNVDIIEYFLYINQIEKNLITEMLEERRDTNMIVQEFIKRGEIKGKLEGIKEGQRRGKFEGKLEGKLETAKKMYERGFSIEDIIDITGLSEQDLTKGGVN